jgi:hypothetical protein
MAFVYPPRRKNPKPQRLGSNGFQDGWNSLPHPSALKDTELAELINGIYSQYGSISKRQGTRLVGTKDESATRVINGGMFYDIGGFDYMLRITDTGIPEQFNFLLESWSPLTGSAPTGYVDTDPEFVETSVGSGDFYPVFDPSVFINIVQANGQILFSSETDRVTIFDEDGWHVFVELDDPATRPTVAKTGSGTGTRSYYYRYADLNEFGTTLASPANTGAESAGAGFYNNMPELDGSTYLTITLPAAATGSTRRALYRGDTAGNEFFLAELAPTETTYIDKNVGKNEFSGSPTSTVFTVPIDNTTPGYHFYLLTVFANSLVGTTVEEGKSTLVWSAGEGVNLLGGTTEINTFTSFALADGAGFDGYAKGDGTSINAIQAFSIANKDGLAVFKDSRVGLLEFDSQGGGNIQNVNVIRGTMSPLSPHVAGDNIRFYSSEGVASLGHEANFGTILRYSVMSLKADSLTRRVTTANLPQVCSEYIKNLSLFGISTGTIGSGNDSILVYDERYNTWAHWTGLHPSVFWKAVHPTTKIEEMYFGVSNASETYGGNVVKMFQGRTDYATSTGTGQKITFSMTTKQYDKGVADRFKKYDRAVLVFGSLTGKGTTAQVFVMGAEGTSSYPRLKVTNPSIISGFGGDEWGTQEVGMMNEGTDEDSLPLKYINLQQKDLFWVKLNIQNDGVDDEVTVIGIFFYLTDSNRQLPSRTRLTELA